MKIISLVSSGRRNGNTNQITEHIETEILKLSEKNNIFVDIKHTSIAFSGIQFCIGCRVCFDKGEILCPLKDDLLAIKSSLDNADGIILASPVYVEDVNGVMKNWIDRMAFNCHRPAFSGKSAIILTTSGIGSSNHAIKTLKAALGTWGFHICAQNRFRTGANIDSNQITAQYENAIKKMAKRLFESVSKKQAANPSFYSLMVFKVQQSYWLKIKNAKDTVDYKYWSDKGWLMKSCDYFIPIKTNKLKVAIARFVGRIIAIFFI